MQRRDVHVSSVEALEVLDKARVLAACSQSRVVPVGGKRELLCMYVYMCIHTYIHIYTYI